MHSCFAHQRRQIACAGPRSACYLGRGGCRRDCCSCFCAGYLGIQEGDCIGRGCCWLPVDRGAPLAVDQPWCFHPNTGRSEYRLSGAENTSALPQG